MKRGLHGKEDGMKGSKVRKSRMKKRKEEIEERNRH